LGAGIGVALIALHRPLLHTRGPWLAAALALAIWAPNIAWQAAHDFPTVEFARNALAQKYKPLGTLAFAKVVALIVAPWGTILSCAALATPFALKPRSSTDTLRSRWGDTPHPPRSLAVALATVVVIVGVTKGAKPEYLGAALPTACALGAVVCARLV